MEMHKACGHMDWTLLGTEYPSLSLCYWLGLSTLLISVAPESR